MGQCASAPAAQAGSRGPADSGLKPAIKKAARRRRRPRSSARRPSSSSLHACSPGGCSHPCGGCTCDHACSPHACSRTVRISPLVSVHGGDSGAPQTVQLASSWAGLDGAETILKQASGKKYHAAGTPLNRQTLSNCSRWSALYLILTEETVPSPSRPLHGARPSAFSFPKTARPRPTSCMRSCRPSAAPPCSPSRRRQRRWRTTRAPTWSGEGGRLGRGGSWGGGYWLSNPKSAATVLHASTPLPRFQSESPVYNPTPTSSVYVIPPARPDCTVLLAACGPGAPALERATVLRGPGGIPQRALDSKSGLLVVSDARGGGGGRAAAAGGDTAAIFKAAPQRPPVPPQPPPPDDVTRLHDQAGIRSCIAVVVGWHSKPQGVLVLGSERPGAFDGRR
jgi:hypothetical protein